MKKYMAYGIGAALVDTEIKVQDAELEQMRVEKGLMTLVDQERQRELLNHLRGSSGKGQPRQRRQCRQLHDCHRPVWRPDFHVLQGRQ